MLLIIFVSANSLIAALSAHDSALLILNDKEISSLNSYSMYLLSHRVMAGTCHGPDPQSLILLSEMGTCGLGFFSCYGHNCTTSMVVDAHKVFTSKRIWMAGEHSSRSTGDWSPMPRIKLLNILSLFCLFPLIL